MKTNSYRSTLLAGAALVLGTGLAIPAAIAGPGSGVTIWRNTPETKAPAAAPSTATDTPRACTDARLISVKESKWVRGAGRGMVIVDAGKARVCNSCATPMAVVRLHDRNSNGPKASKPMKALHDCGKAGCGEMVARLN